MPEKLTPEVVDQAPEVATADVLDVDALLNELTGLSPLDYDRRRTSAAKLLGVRVGALDVEVAARRAQQAAAAASADETTAPVWAEAVDGAHLLSDLTALYRRYIVLPEGGAEACALWAVHTYCLDASSITPRLTILSPQKRCGKTNLLALLSVTTRNALASANISASALFRAVDQWRSTLIVDEADRFLRDNEELVGVINAGHFRPTAYVVRSVPVEDGWEARQFYCFAPVAIAGIGRLPDTIADRAIPIKLRRKTKEETVERLRLDGLEAQAAPLRQRCARWAQDHLAQLKAADPDIPATLHDRAADNWRPLAAIAEVAEGAWPQLAQKAMLKISADDVDDDALGELLLGDIKEIFAEKQAEQLPSADLAEALHALDERPWAEWGRQMKPLSVIQLARLLRPFEIRPKNLREGKGVPKGYSRADFHDAWARYLPQEPLAPSQPATPLQSSNGADLTIFDPLQRVFPAHYGERRTISEGYWSFCSLM